MLIQGDWRAEGRAAKIKAILRAADDKVTIESDAGLLFSGVISDLKASARIGNVERKLTLLDDSIFATSDNDGIDLLFKQSQPFLHFVHRLESRIGWVAIALVLTIAFSFGSIKWGIPWISVAVAHALPHKTNELIAVQAFDFLDEYVFEESELNEEKRTSINAHFNDTLLPIAKHQRGLKFTLHFRRWQQDGQDIPNALALPSGDIILTDKFVELSQNQNEIDAVLLHEIGHVVHRHSLQRVIQGSLITTVVMMITGDISSIADIGLGLGSLLVSSEYARDHESEADLYAFETMLQAGIDPIAFSNIMTAMTRYFEKYDDSIEGSKPAYVEPDMTKKSSNKDDSLLDYISSHPVTSLRIERANRYSKCFRQNLKVCQ